MAVFESNAGSSQGNPNLLRQTSHENHRIRMTCFKRRGWGKTGGERKGDIVCVSRISPWAASVMEDRDRGCNCWKFVGCDADPGQSEPKAALFGVSCLVGLVIRLPYLMLNLDRQACQAGTAQADDVREGQELSTARLRRQMTPSRNCKPNLRNPQYSWLALGYLPL